MVNSKRYDPTITRFQKHTKSFVSGKTKKGHLNNEDEEESGDVKKEEGILVKVNINEIYGNGWIVKVDDTTYKCSYGDNIIYLPKHTVVGNYYVPKSECKVEISIDKKTKINTITKIKDPNKTPISMTANGVELQANGTASLKVNDNSTFIEGDELVVGGDVTIAGDVQGDITIKTSEDNDLPDKISVTNLYKRIEILESQISNK